MRKPDPSGYDRRLLGTTPLRRPDGRQRSSQSCHVIEQRLNPLLQASERETRGVAAVGKPFYMRTRTVLNTRAFEEMNCRSLGMFRSPRFMDVSLNQWMGATRRPNLGKLT
jgi:hypothetical protein